MDTDRAEQRAAEETPPETGVENEAAVPEETPPGNVKPSWEEILEDPEYRSSFDAAVQRIVKGRLRDRRQAEERLESLAPVLRALEECWA